MDKQDTCSASLRMVRYETSRVEGLNIAYRQAGNPENPKLVLLHGFPASSHQYRNLLPALADRFHVIAPDYPGFGNSDMPDPASLAYTFDRLCYITASFLAQKRFDRCAMHFGRNVLRRASKVWQACSSLSRSRPYTSTATSVPN